MPKLKSYEVNDPENKSLLGKLATATPHNGAVYHITMSGEALLSGGRSWATVATVEMNSPSNDGTISKMVTQFPARFSSQSKYKQLVLMNTNDEEVIKEILEEEEKKTKWDDSQHLSEFKRFHKHEAKSAGRLAMHYERLQAGLGHKAKGTEVRGEYAAAKVLLTLFGDGSQMLQMKKGKASSGGQNGIDQIWVKRDKDGNIKTYFIVEAKGSTNARMGNTNQGVQMSPRWLVNCLFMMMKKNNGNYVDTSYGAPKQERTAQKILDAIFDDKKSINVVGLCVHALWNGGEALNHIVELTDFGRYNDPQTLTAVRNETAVQTQLGIPMGY